MAIGEITVDVSIEAALHRVLKTALQELADEHKVRVTDVAVEWEHYTLGMPQQIRRVRITTESQ